MINCTLPCSDSHCIFLISHLFHTLLLSPSEKQRVQVVIFVTHYVSKLFNCYHDIESYRVRFHSHMKFTKILLNSCFYIVYTVYVLMYWFAQTSKSLTSPLVVGL